MQTLMDVRNQRKIKKLATQTITSQKPAAEPRVIADEPMEDEDDDIPFTKEK